MNIHEETLKIARNLIEKDPSLTDWVISKFPELKESEDERIRKALIKLFKTENFNGYVTLDGIDIEDVLTWLEKQCEQKTVDEIAKEVCKNKTSAMAFLKSTGIINEKGELADEYKIEQDEQNPFWSEEDDIMAHDIDYALRCQITYPISKLQSMSNWILNLKDRVQLKPKQEWSEEDEEMLRRCISATFDHGYLKECNWLKCIKDRVQPQNSIVTDEELAQAKKDAYNNALDKIEYHSDEPTFDDGWSAAIWYLKKRNAQPQSTWKPSDEQMEGIECTIKTLRYQLNAGDNRLDSLYNDLKKLREK